MFFEKKRSLFPLIFSIVFLVSLSGFGNTPESGDQMGNSSTKEEAAPASSDRGANFLDFGLSEGDTFTARSSLAFSEGRGKLLKNITLQVVKVTPSEMTVLIDGGKFYPVLSGQYVLRATQVSKKFQFIHLMSVPPTNPIPNPKPQLIKTLIVAVGFGDDSAKIARLTFSLFAGAMERNSVIADVIEASPSNCTTRLASARLIDEAKPVR